MEHGHCPGSRNSKIRSQTHNVPGRSRAKLKSGAPTSDLALAVVKCGYENIFFMDFDTQRDFMLSTGALYVPGAERIIPKLHQLFDFARKNQMIILSPAP